jgi:hypothetical protein
MRIENAIEHADRSGNFLKFRIFAGFQFGLQFFGPPQVLCAFPCDIGGGYLDNLRRTCGILFVISAIARTAYTFHSVSSSRRLSRTRRRINALNDISSARAFTMPFRNNESLIVIVTRFSGSVAFDIVRLQA